MAVTRLTLTNSWYEQDENPNLMKMSIIVKVLFNQISVAGWKPVSSESKDEVNEEEVHQLFNLIDTERTGYITPTVRFKQKIYKLII